MSGHNELHVLGLPGSIRRYSYNRWLLEAAAKCAPDGMSIQIYDELGAIPLFSEDLEGSPAGLPTAITALRKQVAVADGILIATPEYNQSVPGVLKNVLDWLSRSPPNEGLVHKPVAVMGATVGRWGTRLAQTQLRHILLASESLVMPDPSLFVPDASARFDKQGRLVDPQTRQVLGALTAALKTWIATVRD